MEHKKSTNLLAKVTTESPTAIQTTSINWTFHSSYVHSILFVGEHIVDYGCAIVNGKLEDWNKNCDTMISSNGSLFCIYREFRRRYQIMALGYSKLRQLQSRFL
jgi:hypothetical protein